VMEDGQKVPLHVVSYKISGGRLLLQVYKFAKMSVCMNNQQTHISCLEYERGGNILL